MWNAAQAIGRVTQPWRHRHLPRSSGLPRGIGDRASRPPAAVILVLRARRCQNAVRRPHRRDLLRFGVCRTPHRAPNDSSLPSRRDIRRTAASSCSARAPEAMRVNDETLADRL